MGTRLYPGTTDDGALEELAGVAAGTAARVRELETAAGSNDRFLDLLAGDEAAGDYHHFLCFGWGKLREPVVQTLATLGLDTGTGTASDIELAHELLRRQGALGRLPAGFHFPRLGGVRWY